MGSETLKHCHLIVSIFPGVEGDFKAWRKIFWRKAGAVLTGRIKLTPTEPGGKSKKKKCEGKCKCKEDGGKCSSDEEGEVEADDEVNRALKGNGYTFMGDNCQNAFCLPSENGSYQKGKNLLPRGSKFFPFKVDPFSEGTVYRMTKRKF